MTDISQASTAGVTDNPITWGLGGSGKTSLVNLVREQDADSMPLPRVDISETLGEGRGDITAIEQVLGRPRLAIAPELPVLGFDRGCSRASSSWLIRSPLSSPAQLRLEAGRFERIAERFDSYGEL